MDLSVCLFNVLMGWILISSIIQEDVQEDFGWKLVHGEVFRSPRWPQALSVLVGNGSQLVAMTGITLGMQMYVRVQTRTLILWMYSFCSCWLLVTLQSGLSRNGHDHFLDFIGKV
jgi:hypothetical protein